VTRRFKPGVILLILLGGCSAVIAGRLINTARASFAKPSADAGTFNSQCAKCHGRDGRAKTTQGRKNKTRDISSAEWQDDVTDERIFNSIRRGKGKMPAFKKLSDAQIDSLVTYVRRLRR